MNKLFRILLVSGIFLFSTQSVRAISDSHCAFLAAAGISTVGGIAYLAATQKSNDTSVDKALRFCSGAISTGLVCYAATQRTMNSTVMATCFGGMQLFGFPKPPNGSQYEPIQDTPGNKIFYGGGVLAVLY